MPDPINTQLFDRSILHRIGIQRYRKGEIDRILAILNESNQEIKDQLLLDLSKITQRGFESSEKTNKQIDILIKKYSQLLEDSLQSSQDQLQQDLMDFGDYERDFHVLLLKEVTSFLGVTIILSKPSLKTIRDNIMNNPFNGETLKAWFENIKQTDVTRVKRAVVDGVAQGKTTDQILDEIVGSKKSGYSDGLMETTRRNVSTILRTSITHAETQAANAVYENNNHIVDAEVFTAVLDSRTTQLCRGLDGEIFDVGKGPMPPLHINCRSERIPIIKGMQWFTGKERKLLFGPVYGKFTYEEWLQKQSKEIQNEVLGTYRAKLFRQGKLKIKDLFDGSGDAYTLQDLKKRDQFYSRISMANNR